MSATKQYKLSVYNTTNNENNLKVIVNLTKFTKMLTMTDNFVINNLVSENKITIDNSNANNVLIVNENGSTSDMLIFIASINSNTGIQNNFYYHTVDKIILNIPSINELDVDNLKGYTINVFGTFYGNSSYNSDTNSKHFNNNIYSLINNLSTPNSLDGIEVSHINLNMTGLDIPTNIKSSRIKVNGTTLVTNNIVSDFLFVKNYVLGLDNKTTLFTVNSYSVNAKDVIELSSFNNPTYIIFPLI